MKIKSLLALLFSFPIIGHADAEVNLNYVYEDARGVRAKVFATNCLICHSSDKVGPDRNGAPEDVNFDTYQATLQNAESAIVRAVEEMTMPPASSGIPPLTEAQRSAMLGWQNEGFPLWKHKSYGIFDGTRLTVPIISVKNESTNYIATLKQILLKSSETGLGYVLETAEPTSATSDNPANFETGLGPGYDRLWVPGIFTVQHGGDMAGAVVGGIEPFELKLIPGSNPMTFTTYRRFEAPIDQYSFKDTTLKMEVKVGNEAFHATLRLTPLESSPTGLGFVLETTVPLSGVSDNAATFDTDTGKVILPYIEMVENFITQRVQSIVRAEMELVEGSDPLLFKLTSYTTIETTEQ
jgi:hypothetical protein